MNSSKPFKEEITQSSREKQKRKHFPAHTLASKTKWECYKNYRPVSHKHRCKNPKQNFSKLNPKINKMESKHQALFARMQGCFNILNQWINIIHYFNRNERKKS